MYGFTFLGVFHISYGIIMCKALQNFISYEVLFCGLCIFCFFFIGCAVVGSFIFLRKFDAYVWHIFLEAPPIRRSDDNSHNNSRQQSHRYRYRYQVLALAPATALVLPVVIVIVIVVVIIVIVVVDVGILGKLGIFVVGIQSAACWNCKTPCPSSNPSRILKWKSVCVRAAPSTIFVENNYGEFA